MGTALIIILFGVIDLGRAYFTYLALKDAAAEGSYFGSVYPECLETSSPVAVGSCADPNNITYRIRNNAPAGGLVNWDSAAITVNVTTPEPGEEIEVLVSYQHQLITPFVGTLAGAQSLTLTARAVAVIVDCEPSNSCY
jgi:Flp pilus assembly protein TadG